MTLESFEESFEVKILSQFIIEIQPIIVSLSMCAACTELKAINTIGRWT